MLTNSQRLRLSAAVVVIVVAISGFFFNSSVKRKTRDVVIMNDLRSLSYSLERYKEHFWKYPAGDHVNLNGGVTLTENGFAPGKEVFFSKTLKGSGPATYVGTGGAYEIIFTLAYNWPQAGLSGTKCTISSGYHLTCQKN